MHQKSPTYMWIVDVIRACMMLEGLIFKVTSINDTCQLHMMLMLPFPSEILIQWHIPTAVIKLQ